MAVSIVSNPNPYCFSLNPMIFEIESTLFSGASAPYTPDEDNLYCYVEIYQKVNGGDDVLLASKNIPYSKYTKTAKVDIHSVIDLAPTLPNLTPDLGNPDALFAGTASDSYMTVYIKYADSYGTPSTPDTLSTSGDYYVIYGYSKSQIPNIPFLAGGTELHAYIDKNGDTFAKPVTKSTPDWVYVLAMQSNPAVRFQLDVTVTYTDGTTEDFTIDTYTMDTDQSVHWFATGYTQLGLEALAASEIYSYQVKIREQGEVSAMATVNYILDAETPWERYVIYDNGLGGVETVCMKGKAMADMVAERSDIKKTWKDFDYEVAQMDNIAVRGHEELDLSSGWYDEVYIRHLSQLLLAKLWLFDSELGFTRQIILSNDIKNILQDDVVLHTLEIRIRDAWDDFAKNNFYHKWLA